MPALLAGISANPEPSSVMVSAPCSVVGRKADHDLAAMAMFNGIVNRLARDVVKVRGHRVIMNQHRGKTLEAAGNPKQIFHFARPLLERGHEPLRVGHDRQQAARQFTRLMNGFIHKSHDLGRVLASGRLFSTSFCSCTLLMNAMPVRCWPRPSCKSCPMRRCSRPLTSRMVFPDACVR